MVVVPHLPVTTKIPSVQAANHLPIFILDLDLAGL